jgi:O-antigen/teichoic acid export membrane protein
LQVRAAPATCNNRTVDPGDEATTPAARGPEYRGGRAATNSVVMALGQLFVLVIALVTTPITFNRLGYTEFGIWTLALSAIGYITVIDPGFTDLVTRYGAQARVRGETHVAARICALGSLVWLGFGAVLTPLVILLVPLAVHHLGLNPGVASVATSFFYWSYALVVFGSLQATLSGRLTGIGEQWLVTTIDVATRVVYAVVLVALLWHGWRLSAIVAATTTQFALAYLATFVAIARRDGVPYASPRGLDRQVLRDLFRFGGLLQFNSLLDTLTYETDPVVIAVLVGPQATALWGIAQRLSRQITYFAYIPQSNVLPAIAASHAAGEGLEAMRRMYVRANRIVVLLGAFLAGTIIAFGPIMLRAWLFHSFTTAPHDASIATILVALTMMAGLPRPVTANAILAMGRVGLGVRAQIMAFVVNVVLTLALVGPMGLNGVLLGTVVAKVVATTYLTVRFAKIVESTFFELVWPWLAPLLAITTLTAVAGRVAMHLWPGAHEHWLTAFVALIVLGLAYSGLYALGLRLTHYFSAEDLEWLKGTAPGRLGRVLSPRVIELLSGTRP